jgi:hypothetical protein
MSGSLRWIAALLVLALIALVLYVALAPVETEPIAAPTPTDGSATPSVRPDPERAPVEREAPPPDAPRDDPAAAEAPPEGDLFALLAWLELPGHGPVTELVADAARFDALFASRHPERWIEAGPYVKKLREPLVDGAEIAVEPGLWKLEGLDPVGMSWPEDVTLAGSGSATTLFVLGGLRPAGNVVRFKLRDCTLFTDNRPFLELADAYAGLTFERVRFVGWDSGVGFAPLVRAKGLGVRMVDCELTGAYGRAPGSGCLFEVPSAALVARLERCRLSFLRVGVERWDARASVVLTQCSGTDIVDVQQQHAGLLLAGTVLQPWSSDAAPRRLELDALFPQWQQKIR